MFALTVLSIFAGKVLAGKGADLTGEVRLSSGRIAKNAVVYFEGSEKAKPMKDAMVDQRDRTFIPHVSVVTVGTKVRFPNNDVVFHNVFTEYHSERFDLGMYPKGTTKIQTFDRPGLAILLCNIHPYMSAFVMCVDTPYYAVADKNGQFHIANVASGEYNVHVWQESGETFTGRVTVNANKSFQFKTQR